MLRIAVPNKGMLAETANDMLVEAGYRGRRDSRELTGVDVRNGVEFFYLRPRDIATYVGSGVLDAGITGRDLLLDAQSAASEVRDLGFGESTFRFAGPAGAFREAGELRGKRVATSYAGLLGRWFAERGIEVQLVPLDGAVESAIQLGVADAVADVVSTGETLRKAGLEVFGEPILESSAVLISTPEKLLAAQTLVRRLESVLVARRYVLIDYDIEEGLLERATALTPGFQSPTISQLGDPGWCAVRSMVPADGINQLMDELDAIGARAIIVTSLRAVRV